MSTRSLALHAQRIGRVFAAVSTWARLIRERGWLRPRRRIYAPEPKQGVRASHLANARRKLRNVLIRSWDAYSTSAVLWWSAPCPREQEICEHRARRCTPYSATTRAAP